jgi:hypothetical protein
VNPDEEQHLRRVAAANAAWGISEALDGLWSIWKAIADETPATAREFAAMLETKADDWRTHAADLERRDTDGVWPPKRAPKRIVELRMAIENGDEAEMVRSDLLRFMKGLECLHDVPSLAAAWVLSLRDPTKTEWDLMKQLNNGRTNAGS